jgi:hypothetical protein
MSLTSYRAAPPRVGGEGVWYFRVVAGVALAEGWRGGSRVSGRWEDLAATYSSAP